ncbi:ATP-binding protein [Lysobacter sp. TAB13]
MVFLIGPSGVGKTTIRHSVMREMFGDPAYWGKGRTPIVEAFAMLPQSAYFSSRELAKALVNELHAPQLGWLLRGDMKPEVRRVFRAELDKCAEIWEALRPKRTTEGECWALFQRGLATRGCKYVSLDQVTALLVNHRDTSPADHTLHLMALAESAGVMFLMTGVQSAARLWAVHSELRRRVVTVWVPPYSDKRPSDRDAFLRLLKSLSQRYALSREDLLLQMAGDVMAATGGVYAEVMQLLERASALMKESGSHCLLKRHIESAYYGDEDLATLWRDIDAFEQVMSSGDVSKRSMSVNARWKLKDSSAKSKNG